ncbi:DUF1622 domain-containing protein [Clostridium sp. AL.422]|uniref:DUF1622 domain-containing protein n=1 Tax=Clostridium TaxID=1485 RepID=UPI00293DBF9D|nr:MULTISPECIES: DUF1622 domain-containing protein [unclassified Clostridium]MDV4152212.1 DUF1622 domain-containing protein [Clostridium sp. AL.422]
MLEIIIEKIIPPLVNILELIGILVISIGSIKAFYHYIVSLIKKNDYPLKWAYANSMATALEFKLAAEILKTVIIRDIKELVILGSITLLRGLLTIIIHMEMKSENPHKQNNKKNSNKNSLSKE